MKDFNIAKYLKENHLGPHAILGNYVDLHALKEDLSSDQAEISRLIRQITSKVTYPYLGAKNAQELSQTLSNTQTKDQLRKTLDDLDNPKQQDSNSSKYGECEGNMYFHPQYGCIREREEDLEGLEVVKGFGALKDKSVADKYAEVAKQAGMEGVKVVEKDGVFKIYAKAGQKLNKEQDEMELDTEIPYEGPEHKLDGFGDEFVQDSPVEEIDSMDYDDSVNPFPSLMPDEQGKFDRMMGLIDQNIEPRLGQIKSIIDGSREQGYADRTIFTVLARHPLVRNSIEALVDDGFEFQDIIDFFATDFSQNEEIAGYKAGVQMEGTEEYTVDFGTNTMTYTLDRANSVLRGLKPGIVPGADREEDIIPVTISPEGYLSTTDRSVKDISPKSNKSPFSDPSYRNID
jgi:hypothetical protein